ncbi:MAG: nucleotidyltransferase [Chitinophagales bacterium]|nr:nucleotidyltransferase [Chitinophagales bacterium]
MEAHASVFKKIVKALNKHRVDCVLIGGYAVIFHGYARTTSDIDFWYSPTLENYFKLLKALKEAGANTSELEEEVFNPKNTFLRLKIEQVKIEFLCSIPGNFTYREVSAAALKTKIKGVSVKVIHLDHLIENKSKVNRPIDKLDVIELKTRKKEKGA